MGSTSKDEARLVMTRIGKEILDASKAEIQGTKGPDKVGLGVRDLLSLLVHANMATGIPEHQRMSEADVISRKS